MNGSATQLWLQAERSLAAGNARQAEAALAALVHVEPGHVKALLLLSAIAYTEGRLRDAAQRAIDATTHGFSEGVTLCNAISALLRTGEVAQAQRCLQDPLIASCRSGALLVRLAGIQQAMENHPESLALLDRAIAAGLDNPDIRYMRSVQLTFNGRTSEAEAELEACLRGGTSYGRAAVTLARLRKQTPQSNHLELIRARRARAMPRSEDHAALEFALYKELEDLGDHAAAWDALERGNALMAALLQHEPAREHALVDGLISATRNLLIAAPAAQMDGVQPIFIVGMPRSGTTLLDRILGNHRDITSAGELGDFARQVRWASDHVSNLPLDETILARLGDLDLGELGRRYLLQTRWRAKGSPFFVDKLPINYLWAGLIAKALPGARILHLVRDPMDVCFSNYRAYFGKGYAYSYSLDGLAQQYLDYQRLMRHWHQVAPGRIMDVSYERLTHDSEAMARDVFDFCGLEYEPGCLDLGRNKTPVATLSAMQVRTGIGQAAFGEWRRYASQLTGLQQRLLRS